MGQNAALSRKEYYSNAFVPLCSDHISELNVRLNRENPSPLLPPRRPPAIVLLLLDNAPLAPSSNYLVCLLVVWRHSTKMVIKIWICCTLLHGQLPFWCMQVRVWRRALKGWLALKYREESLILSIWPLSQWGIQIHSFNCLKSARQKGLVQFLILY